MKPFVSILCVTYNHEKYIRKTLDGFLMQKINFPIEIVVHDDASTDDTIKILKEYKEKHPIINLVIEKENQYSKGNATVFLENLYKSARGKYIAWCDGDDYWIDPKKLQKQVDFMENNPDYSICFHPVKVQFENNIKRQYLYPAPSLVPAFNIDELLKTNFIQTNSVMYRKQKYKTIPRGIMPVDWYMHLYHAQYGKIGFINKPMSVYNRHPDGIWWNSHANINKIWDKHGNSHLNLYVELLKIYGDNYKYHKIIQKHIYNMVDKVLSSSNKKVRQEAIDRFPTYVESYLLKAFDTLNKIKKDLKEQKDKNNQIEQALGYYKSRNEDLEHELKLIKASKIWQFRNKAAKLIGRK